MRAVHLAKLDRRARPLRIGEDLLVVIAESELREGRRHQGLDVGGYARLARRHDRQGVALGLDRLDDGVAPGLLLRFLSFVTSHI